MTEDRPGIDHVIDAIDNALGWTDPWADAMTVQYGGNGDRAPGGAAAPPGPYAAPRFSGYWDDEPHGGPVDPAVQVPFDLSEWESIGWLDEADLIPPAFRGDGAESTEEIWSMNNPEPIRVVSLHYMPPNLMMIGQLPEGIDLAPYISAASFGVDAAALNEGFRRAGESLRELGEACRRSADTVQEHYAPLMREIAQRLRVEANQSWQDSVARFFFGPTGQPPATPTGITPSGEPPGPDEARRRALEARRNRNTGPARNPHRHRGI